MKKIFTRLICAFMASLSALSCAQVQLEEPQELLPTQYEATIETDEDEDTKMSLTSSDNTIWTMGDVLTFITSSNSYAGTAKATTVDNNGNHAIFTVNGTLTGTPKFAVYPSSGAGAVDGQTIVAWANETQTGLFKDACVMISKASGSLRFKCALPMLEFEIPQSLIKKVVIEGQDYNGYGIAGGTKCTFGTTDTYMMLNKSEHWNTGADKITINNITVGKWYATIRPSLYYAGSIVINCYDADNRRVYSTKLPKQMNITRRDIVRLGNLSDHNNNMGALPPGQEFRTTMVNMAGSYNNIKSIQFSVNALYINTGDKKIADNTYMGYNSSTGKISVYTTNSSITANPDCALMFYYLPNLTEITGLNYVNTSQTTSMRSMFENCSKLSTLDMSSNSSANVTSMESMFAHCEAMQKLDLRNFNTSNVIDMSLMFTDCYALRELFLGSNFKVTSACSGNHGTTKMFQYDAPVIFCSSSVVENLNQYLVSGTDYSPRSLDYAVDMGTAGWWSAMNQGANVFTDFGYYFSWGNGTGHRLNNGSDGYSFSLDNFKSTTGYTRTGNWLYAPINDGEFYVPTKANFTSLLSVCNRTSATMDGISGYKYTHKTNGNWLFFPSAGYFVGTGRSGYVYYWAGDYSNNHQTGTAFVASSGTFLDNSVSMYYGLPVRPIARYGLKYVTGITIGYTSNGVNRDLATSLSMWKGESYPLYATVTPSDATDKSVRFYSENTSVVTVSNGYLTAVGAGTARIWAVNDVSGVSKYCNVTVSIRKPTQLKLMFGFGTQSEVGRVSGSEASLVESGNGTSYYRIDAVVSPADAEYNIQWTATENYVKPYSSEYSFGSNGRGGSSPLLFYCTTSGTGRVSSLICTVTSLDGTVTLSKQFTFNVAVNDDQCIYFNLSSSSGFSPYANSGSFGTSDSPSSYQGLFSSTKYTGYNYYAHFTNPVTRIPQNAFYSRSQIKAVKLPSTLKTVYESAFRWCPNLSKVEFNYGLKRIEQSAFESDPNSSTGLSDFVLPASLEYIGISAFQDNRTTTLNIPPSVTTLDTKCFYDSEKLTSVTMRSATPPTCGSQVFGLSPKLTTIYIPLATYNDYWNAVYFRTMRDYFKSY